jgi:four helix bundle suffix protein
MGNSNTSNNGDGNRDSHNSQQLPQPPQSSRNDRLLPPRGDYQTLHSYQKAEVIYEITYRFCRRFLARSDRTIDQMVQAARSGKQNIIEGSKAATTSKETEIKLTNVARASLEELLEDYRDFLRVRDLRIWEKDCREAEYARRLGMQSPLTFAVFREITETRPAEVLANIAICLIHQANYLLDRQLLALEKTFLQDGGLRERMTRARLQYRKNYPGKRAS